MLNEPTIKKCLEIFEEMKINTENHFKFNKYTSKKYRKIMIEQDKHFLRLVENTIFNLKWVLDE